MKIKYPKYFSLVIILLLSIESILLIDNYYTIYVQSVQIMVVFVVM